MEESTIERELAENGVYVSTTVGSSMRPMLRNRRDRVVVVSVGDKKLGRRDLPLYRRPTGEYVMHRVLGEKDGVYIIRGDNTYRKEKVPKEWILGYVSEFYRNGKHIETSKRSYRIYAEVWQWIYPLRWCVHTVRRAAAKVYHTVFRNKK